MQMTQPQPQPGLPSRDDLEIARARAEAERQAHDQFAQHRQAILNREFVRMQEQGWDVEFAGDYLRCVRRDEGTAPIVKFLFSIALGIAAALVAIEVVAAANLSVELPSKPLMIAAGAAIGLLSWYMSFRKAESSRKVVTVSLDGQGRPVVLPE